jgi:hypothetical protein
LQGAATQSGLSAGAYSLLVQDSASGCSVTANALLEDSASFVASASVTDVTTCNGSNGAINITTPALNGYSFAWTGTGIAQGQEDQTGLGIGFYSVTITETASNCSRVLQNIEVKGPVTPTPVVIGDTLLCNGTSLILSVADTGAYQWFRNNNPIAAATDDTLIVALPGRYTVRVIDGICQATSAPKNVQNRPLPPAPNITTGSGTRVCDGTGVLLIANSSVPVTLHQWQLDGVDIAGSNSSSITAFLAGVYTVIITDSNGCQRTSNGRNVTVLPLPSKPIITTILNNKSKIIIF